MDVQIRMLRSFACAASLFLALSLTASADDLVGRPSIIDGDTLEIHGTRIRLWGHRRAGKYPALSGRRQPAISLRRESRQRSRRLHRATAGELRPDITGSIWADRGDLFGRRGRSRGMARP